VLIADDERPARSYLAALLRGYEDVDLVGEATNGAEAVELIESLNPELALLDLHMPELDGFGVVRVVKKNRMPLVAFVTAHDEYAVRAFELNAVDYVLKPVERARLRQTINRALEQLERTELKEGYIGKVQGALEQYEQSTGLSHLERIPVRQRDEIVIVPVKNLASVVAEGEILHLATIEGQRYTITYCLKDLEARLDPGRFVRLGRGTLANLDLIRRVNTLPGGNYLVTLTTGETHNVSRIQSRILREQLLRL
jgi:two-component system LytT family response regulator